MFIYLFHEINEHHNYFHHISIFSPILHLLVLILSRGYQFTYFFLVNYVYHIFINCGLMSKNINMLIKISLSINNIIKDFFKCLFLPRFFYSFLLKLHTIYSKNSNSYYSNFFFLLFMPLSFLAVIILSRVCMHLHFRYSKLLILYIDFFVLNMLKFSKMHVIICISDYC